jgi:Raf kinase inhibitor-like YbhB/YbcL family protein
MLPNRLVAPPAMTMKITSPAFAGGQPIPPRFTCEGEDISPPLAWTGVPAEARSLALVCDDPDAPRGIWVHWIAYHLPPGAGGLAAGLPSRATLADGTCQGTTDFGRTGYGGPCPPPGKTHHYHFKLHALDAAVPLAPGATKDELLRAIKGHVIAEARLVGTYRRTG